MAIDGLGVPPDRIRSITYDRRVSGEKGTYLEGYDARVQVSDQSGGLVIRQNRSCQLIASYTQGMRAPAPTPASTPASTPAPAPTPIPVLPFDEAVLSAADKLFASARLPPPAPETAGRHVVAIDPLIDGVTGAQSITTRSMQSRIIELARERYPQFEFRDFSTATIATAPLVLLGSLTGVNERGAFGAAYRIWLVLADLRSGTIVARGVARAPAGGLDALPLAHFRDSPVWAQDRSTEAYLRTCEAPIGAPIDPVYLDGILTAALVSDAVEAYEGGRYQEALDLYRSAALTSAGDQLRVYNGLYLANWKLGRHDAAAEAFDRLGDFGLRRRQLAVKFLFKPGSTAFWPDPEVSGPYEMWLQRLAYRIAGSGACLELVGHTSASGSALMNERLSLLRAEYIKSRLEDEVPELATRMAARGVGARENIVGTGTDDAADALDRRVEFKVIDCVPAEAARRDAQPGQGAS
jgi:outer membrane protein OmpA-like peptidoglycan-associated protein